MKILKHTCAACIAVQLCILVITILSGCEPYSRASQDRQPRFAIPVTSLDKILRDKKLKIDDSINLHVDLSTGILQFRYGSEVLKRYRISSGINTPMGDKEKEGDLRTPRGEFYICSKAEYSDSQGSLGTRWMQLSYPNLEAAGKGLEKNMISKSIFDEISQAIKSKSTPPQNTPLGSAVGIHGGTKPAMPRHRTAGCIGMYNRDIEEVYKYTKIGTPVSISWGQ